MLYVHVLHVTNIKPVWDYVLTHFYHMTLTQCFPGLLNFVTPHGQKRLLCIYLCATSFMFFFVFLVLHVRVIHSQQHAILFEGFPEIWHKCSLWPPIFKSSKSCTSLLWPHKYFLVITREITCLLWRKFRKLSNKIKCWSGNIFLKGPDEKYWPVRSVFNAITQRGGL